MLWVLKTYVKTDGLENIDNFIIKICVYIDHTGPGNTRGEKSQNPA